MEEEVLLVAGSEEERSFRVLMQSAQELVCGFASRISGGKLRRGDPCKPGEDVKTPPQRLDLPVEDNARHAMEIDFHGVGSFRRPEGLWTNRTIGRQVRVVFSGSRHGVRSGQAFPGPLLTPVRAVRAGSAR